MEDEITPEQAMELYQSVGRLATLYTRPGGKSEADYLTYMLMESVDHQILALMDTCAALIEVLDQPESAS